MKNTLFYDRFIELCNARGVKPTPVLKKIGLSAGCLKKWQSGSVVRANTLEKLAAYFGVNVDYFFSDDAECRKFEVKFTLESIILDEIEEVQMLKAQCERTLTRLKRIYKSLGEED